MAEPVGKSRPRQRALSPFRSSRVLPGGTWIHKCEPALLSCQEALAVVTGQVLGEGVDLALASLSSRPSSALPWSRWEHYRPPHASVPPSANGGGNGVFTPEGCRKAQVSEHTKGFGT